MYGIEQAEVAYGNHEDKPDYKDKFTTSLHDYRIRLERS